MSFLRRSSLSRVCATMAMFALSAVLSLALVSCDDESDPAGNTPVNRAPATPALDVASGAPDDGATGVTEPVTLHWTCSDPDGDVLTYDVYFGTDPAPALSSSDQSALSLGPMTVAEGETYYWRVVAEDPDALTTSSPVWSFTMESSAPVETVSKPSVPTGPASGETGENLTYTASGAVSSFGSALQYRFDWGDGNISDWAPSTMTSADGSHSWVTAGSYEVKAQARSGINHSILSDWSDALTVDVTAPLETISINNNISGPSQLEQGVSGDFTFVGWVESSEGHATEWRFTWGDGSNSDWMTVKEASHAYSSAGTFDVGLEARCATHTTATHARPDMHTVEVAEAETVSPPDQVNNNFAGRPYSQFEYWVESHATSSFGHNLELRYDFGDGVISDWIAEWTRATHTWNLGVYDIVAQARCVEHPDILSEWGAVLTKEFYELLQGLGNAVSGPATGNVGVPVEFTLGTVTSNEGHAVEYALHYRRSGSSEWILTEYTPSPIQSITWNQSGTYYVKARARCVEHPDVTTSTRDFVSIVINP